MKKQDLRYIVLFVCSLFLILSCKEGPRTQVEVKGVKLVFEGPLFEGSNTAQATIVSGEVLKNENGIIDPENICEARLRSLTLRSSGGSLSTMSSMVISFTGPETPMLQAGVINPIPKGATSLNLTLGEEKSLGDIFKQAAFYLVADGTLSKDSEENIEVLADLTFELTLKK